MESLYSLVENVMNEEKKTKTNKQKRTVKKEEEEELEETSTVAGGGLEGAPVQGNDVSDEESLIREDAREPLIMEFLTF